MLKTLWMSLLIALCVSGSTVAQHWKEELLVQLPSELMEISGIAEAGTGRVACVQDEKGVLFIVDPERGEIIQSLAFGPPGDYEGLAGTGPGEYWVLRSDGVLFELQLNGEELAIKGEYTLESSGHKEMEGLAYDRKSARLLIAAKDKHVNNKDWRHLFSFDLRSKKFGEKPLLELSLDEVKRQAESLGLEIPRKVTKKGRVKDALKLRFSALEVHPETGDLLLLSSSEPCLLTLGSDGRVKDLQGLDAVALPKPEGLLFLSGERLLIASEAKKRGIGILQTFRWSEEPRPSPPQELPPVGETWLEGEMVPQPGSPTSSRTEPGAAVILAIAGMAAGGMLVWFRRKERDV